MNNRKIGIIEMRPSNLKIRWINLKINIDKNLIINNLEDLDQIYQNNNIESNINKKELFHKMKIIFHIKLLMLWIIIKIIKHLNNINDNNHNNQISIIKGIIKKKMNTNVIHLKNNLDHEDNIIKMKIGDNLILLNSINNRKINTIINNSLLNNNIIQEDQVNIIIIIINVNLHNFNKIDK